MFKDRIPKTPYVAGEEELYEDNPTDAATKMIIAKTKNYKPLVVDAEDVGIRGVATPVIKKMIRDMQSTEPEPLEIINTDVIGNLFDRVKFLKERMVETENAVKERTQMNKLFNDEMDKDISDMEAILANISQKDELREFKLNLTLLRMEKRKENTVFWRDLVALRKSLQELREEYENELKIARMFGDLVERNK